MEGPIADAEPLARFVFDSKGFTKGGEIHWRQLVPSKKDGQRSVFRIAELTDQQASELGDDNVEDPEGRTHIGWARLIAGAVQRLAPLTLRVDEPPDRHAVIGGWPVAPEEQKTLAMQLAINARVATRPATPGAAE